MIFFKYIINKLKIEKKKNLIINFIHDWFLIMEISKDSLKLISYLEKFQRFAIPYEEIIKSKELKVLLDHMVWIFLTIFKGENKF